MTTMLQTLTSILALLVAKCYSVTYPQPQQSLQSNLGYYEVHLRPATVADLDDITTVVLEAFAPGPLYRYAFPKLDQFKEYHWKCMRKEMGKAFVEDPNDFFNVITVPLAKPGEDTARGSRVVSIGAWDVLEPSVLSASSRRLSRRSIYHTVTRCSEYLDANLTKALDYSRQYAAIDEQYIINFPHPQMYLGLLATHPEWDGHGFGAIQCQWGMERARRSGLPATLMATPAGWQLYHQIGFESIANLTITTLDWPEDLWYEYMRHEA